MAGKTRIAEVKHYNDGSDDAFINDPMFEEGEANAYRIIQCVNACEWMEDPSKEIDTLKQQAEYWEKRCELAEAILTYPQPSDKFTQACRDYAVFIKDVEDLK